MMDKIEYAYHNDIFKVSHNKFRGFQYFYRYFNKIFISTKIIFKIYIKVSAGSIIHSTQRNEQPTLTLLSKFLGRLVKEKD